MRLHPGCALWATGNRATVRAAASKAGAGLAQVLAGRDRAASWRWRARGERDAAVAALGAATVLLCVINIATAHGLAGLSASWRDLAAVLAVAPLPLAARFPLLGWRIGWLALLLVPLLPGTWWGGWPWGPPELLALLVAMTAAGIRYERAVLWWMWALTLIPWSVWVLADVPDVNGPASATIVVTAAVIAVDNVGLRLRAQHDLAAQAELADAERTQRAVLEERGRIARELHDVVAHHMSLIAVQAETAPYRLCDVPEPVREEFGSLSATARDALSDMRRLLGVLRDDQPASLAPQPQLGDVPALVDASRRAGVAVELTAPAALAPVPAGVGVCAYRIVQESLSNASQHAPGAAVTVAVSHDGDALLLRVSNGPAASAAAPSRERGPGHGLAGMRERVGLLGGSLSAGPAADGGFVVSALLPLGPTA